MGRARGPEQQAQHLRGQVVALTFDIRQARANGDYATAAILTQRRDELINWRARLVPDPRPAS